MRKFVIIAIIAIIARTDMNVGTKNIQLQTEGSEKTQVNWIVNKSEFPIFQLQTLGSEKTQEVVQKQEPTTESGAQASEVPPEVLFFTSYNVGDEKQNDATPCHGASGKDLCAAIDRGERPVAITKDVRTRYGLKFGDKVKLTGTCPGIYTVEDEMGPRFRKYCIKNQWACIKGDIAVRYREKPKCSGLYSIVKQ